ncbi:MAG: hypothetical protein ACOC0V_04530 [Oceanicaulis sp.]
MSVRRPRRRSAARVFAAPALIAAASVCGLVAALVGDGGYDMAGWIFLAVPVCAALWARFARTQSS